MVVRTRRTLAPGVLASLSALVLPRQRLPGRPRPEARRRGHPGPRRPRPPPPDDSPVALLANVRDGDTVDVSTAVKAWATDGSLNTVILKPEGTFRENPGEVPARSTPGRRPGSLPDCSTRPQLHPHHDRRQRRRSNRDLDDPLRDQGTEPRRGGLPYSIPGDGATVGVAMPVVLTFDLAVRTRPPSRSTLSVTSVPAQVGSWRWVSDREVHWRPKDYWVPGTKVTVEAKTQRRARGRRTLRPDGPGRALHGRPLGRRQVDLAPHYLKVYVGGKLANTIPVTGGKPGFHHAQRARSSWRSSGRRAWSPPARRATRLHDLPDVRYAMRVTWSGEFLHAAPWSVGYQGHANVSHGCVGMSMGNASWLYQQMKVGDPVIVSGTGRSLDEGNGWTDWNMSYADFAMGLSPQLTGAHFTTTVGQFRYPGLNFRYAEGRFRYVGDRFRYAEGRFRYAGPSLAVRIRWWRISPSRRATSTASFCRRTASATGSPASPQDGLTTTTQGRRVQPEVGPASLERRARSAAGGGIASAVGTAPAYSVIPDSTATATPPRCGP